MIFNKKQTQMKENRTSLENFEPLWSQAELLMMTPGFVCQPEDILDPVQLIRDLHVLKIDLETQNKALHHSQQELMKSKIQYTELYDRAPVGFFTIDLKGTMVNVNLTLADMLSMERSCLLNNHIMDYIIFEDHGVFYQHLKDLDTLKSPQVCELRMQKKDGISFDVHLQTALTVDRFKEPEQYRTVVIDISYGLEIDLE